MILRESSSPLSRPQPPGSVEPRADGLTTIGHAQGAPYLRSGHGSAQLDGPVLLSEVR